MRKFTLSIFSLVMAIVFALALATVLGESPLHVARVLFNGALGSRTDFGYSLFYMTPLLFTGLSVAWAMRLGLFNVGAEGQMAVGGIAMATIGIFFAGLPLWLAIPLALVGAFVVGGLWGWFAAWLKIRHGCHEVLATIILNFIAFGLVSWLIVGPLKNLESQNPETMQVGDGFRFQSLALIGGSSPLNTSFFLGMLVALIYGLVFARTLFGFRSRWVGESPKSAELSGVSIARMTYWGMFISGGIAGLAGCALILGYFFKAREGFTSGFGFLGIAVALVGMLNGWGIVAAAFLFGALLKGSLDLEMDTNYITRDLAMVIQALVVLMVITRDWWIGFIWRKNVAD